MAPSSRDNEGTPTNRDMQEQADDQNIQVESEFTEDESDPDYIDDEQQSESDEMDEDEDEEAEEEASDEDEGNRYGHLSAAMAYLLNHLVNYSRPEVQEAILSEIDNSDSRFSSHGSGNRSESSPQDSTAKGRELMNSGEFGMHKSHSFHEIGSKRNHVVGKLAMRELTHRKFMANSVAQSYVPNSDGKIVVQYPARVYSGQFSEDGTLYHTCCQDLKVHIYDAHNPWDMKKIKTIPAGIGRWTITDSALSPSNRWMAYSSLMPIVHLVTTDPNDDTHYRLDFSDIDFSNFSVWSLRFSSDGREIIAGTSVSEDDNPCTFIYDLEAQKVVLRANGHEDDVNAVCFADPSSNVLLSGSDDTIIRVWDRRSMANGASGYLVGHTEGITYVSSKGDGRYCLSNGKDQSMKLWDLRMLLSSNQFRELPRVDYRIDFDYRIHDYPARRAMRHSHDVSVMTYRGHSVLETLIRCHFSPVHTTGQRYLYTGSADGCVNIFHIDGRLIRVLDVQKALERQLPHDAQRRRHYYHSYAYNSHLPTVRDASWHPYLPVLMSAAWSSVGPNEGLVLRHEHMLDEEEEEEEEEQQQA
ncbi:uncharacterized protein VTP21DRAFT_471 [Calcarisporiella thermophila]|uniref:uncharacterized protein n=1 Tax=Calcarisporiella thermophila TaxID=911321 RepID=UPI0037434D78